MRESVHGEVCTTTEGEKTSVNTWESTCVCAAGVGGVSRMRAGGGVSRMRARVCLCLRVV